MKGLIMLNTQRHLGQCVSQPKIIVMLAVAQCLAVLPGYGYTDSFDRRNNRSLGLQWVENESPERGCDNTLAISSNQLVMNQCQGALAYWNEPFQNDQYSKIRFAGDAGGLVRATDRSLGGPAIRIQPSSSWNNASLYLAEYDRQAGVTRLWKYQNQSLSAPGIQLGGDIAGTLAVGEWLEIKAEGSTIQVMKNGTVLITVVDTTFASGSGGIAVRGVGPSGTLGWTDWQGASIWGPQCHQDTNINAPPDYYTFTPPAKGLLVDSAHSIYCASVKRLTDGAPPAGVPSPEFVHAEYATQNHFNAANNDADTRVLIEAGPASGIWVIDLNGNIVKTYSDLQASAEPMWDRVNPFKFYFHTIGGNQIKRRDITTDTTETIATFSEYTAISGQGESDLSSDGNEMILLGQTPEGGRDVFVYNLSNRKKSPALRLAASDVIDWLHVTNNFVVLGFFAFHGGSQTVELYDTNMRFRRRLANFIGHEDVGLDGNGEEILVISGSNAPSPSPCPGGTNCIIKYRLSDGTFTALPPLDWSLAPHIAVPSLPRTPSPWVLVSTYAPSDPDPATTNWKVYTNEVIRLKLDGTAVERLAHHYSRPAGENYNWTPRSSVNAAGTRVLFNSNFGMQYKVSPPRPPAYTDVYMITVPAP
ncbi:MAG TPA: hypothetical protein VMZ30_17665 [Pyrinomonadaceae bacterium]|nr:hypothetical protein [Pyrinomonadaceae bacterium]